MISRGNTRAALTALLLMGVCFVAGLWMRPRLRPWSQAVRMWLSPPDTASEPPKPARFLANGAQLATPLQRFEPGVAVAAGRIYLFSGFIDNDLHVTQRAEVYDAATNT